MNPDLRKERALLIVGLLLIAAGILLNQWTVGYLRPVPRPIAGAGNLLIIWAFQVASVILGAIILIYRNSFTEERLIAWYKNFAAVFSAVVLGFVFMNLALYAATVLRSSIGGIDPVSQKYGDQIRALYPDLDSAQFAEMMKESWQRGYLYEPFTVFKEGPHIGKYVNVDENGFRHVKEQEAWPPKEENFNIFLFGNSTAFNYSLPDDKTIASYIQEFLRRGDLSKKAAVYNFARGFYYSTQERMLYEKLLTGGFVPDAAIFIDGQTEFDQDDQKLRGERPRFTRELEEFFSGNPNSKFLASLPVVTWWRFFMEARSVVLDSSSKVADSEFVSEGIKENIRHYVENKRIIEAVSLIYGVRPVFVWQPISSYKYDLRLQPFIKFDDDYRPTLGYRAMAEHVRDRQMGNNFLYLADMQENIKKPIYVDGLHYSAWWSEEIASRIADFMKARIF